MKERVIRFATKAEVKFLSSAFMVQKKTTEKEKKKLRKVVDCKRLNREQIEIHFRMDGPEAVQSIALPGDKATSVDIEMAFPHIRVSEEFQPYLAFEHLGTCYVYGAMPFGARHSPRIFTRALGYAMAYIRVHWRVRIIAYMDDVLLLHQETEYLELATLQIAVYLQSLGWTLNAEKCELSPSPQITYLGW
jgi:hypothetical protein